DLLQRQIKAYPQFIRVVPVPFLHTPMIAHRTQRPSHLRRIATPTTCLFEASGERGGLTSDEHSGTARAASRTKRQFYFGGRQWPAPEMEMSRGLHPRAGSSAAPKRLTQRR